MTADVNHAFYGWSREELPDRDESQEISVSKMLDHGSISFGRFAFESLDWEKRSVFTHDRCQEELEKFKRPGLVAQKKAYFEEHYKRIRALKALQENQQTELTLEYGGDGSISSQTGEDETAVHIEVPGDASKEATVEVAMEKNHDCEASVPSISDSSREVSVENNGESGSTVLEPLIITEEIEQNNHVNFYDEGISRKHDNLESTAKDQKDSSGCDVDIHPIDRQPTYKDSLVGTEVIQQHQLSGMVKNISRKKRNLESSVGPERATRGSLLHPTIPSAVKLDCKIVLEKSKPPVLNCKDQMRASKVKGPAASVRNGLKLETKNPTETKASHTPKYPAQRTIVSKSKSSTGSSNSTSDRVSRNSRPSPVASHSKPLTEVRSNVTVPRPFSFATERRPAAPAGTRDITPRFNSRTPNRLATSMNQFSDVRNAQDTSKRAARTLGVKSKGLENKRGSEEVKERTLFASCKSHTGRGASTEPPKARISVSVNVSDWNHANPCGGSVYRPTSVLRKDNQKEVASSRMDPLSLKGRRPMSRGGMSHDGTKPRQEMPQWR